MSDFASAFLHLFEQIQTSVGNQPAYLVGGAVRDAMLGRVVHDLDVVLGQDARKAARKTADALGGAFYMLDEARDTARVIVKHASGGPLVIDFATFRAADLEGDLRARDFTINAMALDLMQPTRLIDPLGGAQHLRERVLIPCAAASLSDDPARVLRALRLSLDLSLRIPAETANAIRAARVLLGRVSAERLRDELFRMLEGAQASTALRLMDHFGVVGAVLPELEAMKGVQQSAPHTLDVWEHTLAVLDALAGLFDGLVEGYNADKAASVMKGAAVLALGRYREQFSAHYQANLNPQRSLRSLLALAALYHDSGKPGTRRVEGSGRVRFFHHEDLSAELVKKRAAALALSSAEVQRAAAVVQHHMRIHHLGMRGQAPSRKAIYRYFRATGKAGVDIVLLNLADTLGTYGATLPLERWEDELIVCRALLEAYWEAPETQVNPTRLLRGNDLQKLFHLPPGKTIGRLLEALEEAQACGFITTREDAIHFIENALKEEQDYEEREDE